MTYNAQAVKATKITKALSQLRGEFIDEGKYNAAYAVDEFLAHAGDESKARFFDIMNAAPAPVGMTENIGSCAPD